MSSKLTSSSGTNPPPERIARTRSQSETSDRKNSKLYILSSWEYFNNDPLTVRNVRTYNWTGSVSLSTLKSPNIGTSAATAKVTGNSLSQSMLSPPTPIQILSST